MNARFEQRFICVDVPQARNKVLVHQPTLDSAFAATHSRQELRLGYALSIRAERPPYLFQLRFGQRAQSAEAPHITEAQFFVAIVESHEYVGMWLNRSVVRGDRELARHAQAHQKKTRRLAFFARQLDGNRLAPARDLGQRLSFNSGNEFLRGADDNAPVANVYGCDAAS
jgi:hypothetical protein